MHSRRLHSKGEINAELVYCEPQDTVEPLFDYQGNYLAPPDCYEHRLTKPKRKEAAVCSMKDLLKAVLQKR